MLTRPSPRRARDVLVPQQDARRDEDLHGAAAREAPAAARQQGHALGGRAAPAPHRPLLALHPAPRLLADRGPAPPLLAPRGGPVPAALPALPERVRRVHGRPEPRVGGRRRPREGRARRRAARGGRRPQGGARGGRLLQGRLGARAGARRGAQGAPEARRRVRARAGADQPGRARVYKAPRRGLGSTTRQAPQSRHANRPR
jgi:hypothetical protein